MTSANISATGMTRPESSGRGIGARSRTVTAFFERRDAAQKASSDLVAAGVPGESIKITEGAEPSAATDRARPAQDKSFWDELKDLFLPDEDRYSYAEGLRRGGYLLSVRVDEANYDRTLDILDNDGAIDMSEREASWRSQGWSGFQGARDPGTAPTGMGASPPTTDLSAPIAAQGPGSAARTGRDTTTRRGSSTAAASTARGTEGMAAAETRTGVQAGRDEVIPVYEETAQIAKRDVNHGRVRLRSYVVETPVDEQIDLRSESVQVERRPVDRPVDAGDAIFKDRVIEAEEHAEEATINKQARVKEEVTLRKTVENQPRTISDSVRRTEVEIDDQRGGRAIGETRSPSVATDRSRIVENMDVIASDGTKIGTVDHLDGPDRIKLAKNTSPDGQHHEVPLTWVDHVDTHVHLNKTLAEIKAQR